MINKFKYVFLFLTGTLFYACGDGASTKTEETVEKVEVEQVKETSMDAPDLGEFEFYTILINMPTPLDEFGHMEKDGVSFNKSLMAPVANATKHSKESAIALNCGVYIADMTYQAVYHETGELLNYTAAAFELADKIKAAKAFDHFISEKMEANMDSKDSLQIVIEKGLEAIEEEFVETKNLVTATQFMMGSWVEMQYILTQAMLNQPEDKIATDLKQHIFEQREHLQNLLLLLHEVKDDAGLHEELEKLIQLEASFTKVHEASEVDHKILVEVAEEIKVIRTDLLDM
jgi:hypothetical protein